MNDAPNLVNSRPLRVVHICKVKGIAGAERHLLTLLPAQRQAGDDVQLIVLEDPAVPVPQFLSAAAARGIAVDVVKAPLHFDPTLTKRLTERLRRQSPDVVHTHLVHADVYGLPAARHAGVTATVSSRHDNNPFRRGRIMRRITRRSMRDARRVIAISKAVARFARDVEGVNEAAIAVIPYGLEPIRASQEKRREAREVLGCTSNAILVGVVGRLIHQKGIDVAIDAFARISRTHDQAALIIVGDGPLRSALQARAERLGLGQRARFAGWIENAQEIMPAFDLMLMPSRWEGLGLAALEAMACSRPLVASDVDALPEIVIHGSTGTLVPREDAAALAAAMAAYLDNPGAAAAAGEEGRKRMIECFSVHGMTRATRAVYQQALST